eukprot:4640674-Karenia_brevis.AAC.1
MLLKFQEVKDMVHNDVPFVLFVDANARSPLPDDYFVGDFGHAKASATTPGLTRFIKGSSVVLANTFEKNMRPGVEHGTYYWHPFQSPVRIDFIGHSVDCNVEPLSTDTHAISTGYDSLDHVAVSATIVCPCVVGSASFVRWKAPYNRKLVKDPECCAKFA